MVRYSTRSCAHSKCWVERRPLNDLPWHQIEQLPWSLLKEHDLMSLARQLIAEKNNPKSARQKRIDKIFGKPVVAHC